MVMVVEGVAIRKYFILYPLILYIESLVFDIHGHLHTDAGMTDKTESNNKASATASTLLVCIETKRTARGGNHKNSIGLGYFKAVTCIQLLVYQVAHTYSGNRPSNLELSLRNLSPLSKLWKKELQKL